MRRLKFLLALGMLAGSAGVAWGHGFALSLSGNQLIGTSNDFPGNGNPNLFNEMFELIGGQLRTDHGAPGTNLFGTGKVISFDAFGPLWYSDGGPAVQAPAGISLLIEDQQAAFLGSHITVRGSSSFVPGYQITGNTAHEFLSTLQGATIPEGVYGFSYVVKGSPVGGNPYAPTHLLVATWMTPNFDPGPDPLAPESPLQLAVQEIYNAAIAVPEPSSVVLLALGLGGLALHGWRRRRQSRQS